MTRIAALDIGGANIKAAAPDGAASSVPFELWRRPEELAGELAALIAARLAPLDVLAVTLTGELCDCYSTKSEGVRRIVESASRACRETAPRAEVLVWRTDQTLAAAEDALEDPLPSAAANWLALACFAGRYAPRGLGVLIDIGSTTTDIVPLVDGRPMPAGLTDTDRLIAGELIYAGISRTPVAALVHELPYRGRMCPVASELFATARDAHLILGGLAEDEDDRATADGRPATRAHARARLARMVCADPADFSDDDAAAAAGHILDAYLRRFFQALTGLARRTTGPVDAFVVCGAGEFLARRAMELTLEECALVRQPRTRLVSLAAELGPEASAAAPAVALRQIALERCR
ncbi:MAG: H4MPT-linked C1 transfer pathway protein [Planctomycetes bacterium]|nr:H4MPT-linked C1 transfer pathway protein [Planctomycetota bacterium]